MLEFNEKLILTGIQERKSQKTGKEYKIINYLGESGETFGTMVDCEIPEGLNQLDKVDVKFKVLPGQYTQLRTIGLKKVI